MTEVAGTTVALIKSRLSAIIETTQRLLADDARLNQIANMAAVISSAVSSGNKILIFGNGGSAADAQHLAAEFVGGVLLEGQSIPAPALADSSAVVTALANDYDYSTVFARQINVLGKPGDIALGLSTSGTSVNVLARLQAAWAGGLVTMAITGDRPSPLEAVTELCLRISSTLTPRIQECYIAVAHTVCELVELTIVEQAIADPR